MSSDQVFATEVSAAQVEFPDLDDTLRDVMRIARRVQARQQAEQLQIAGPGEQSLGLFVSSLQLLHLTVEDATICVHPFYRSIL